MISDFFKTLKLESFLYALLLILPTFEFINVEFYLLFLPILLFKYKDELKRIPSLIQEHKHNKLIWFVFGIPILSLINRIAHVDIEEEGIKGLYSFAYLLPLLFFIAKLTLNKEVVKYLIYFLAIEVVIGIYEFLMGQSSIFRDAKNYFEFSNYELLYNTRVFGLAHNSSVFAEKILLGIILLDYINIRFKKLFLILFLIGITITFNRTILFAYLFYVLFSNFHTIVFDLKRLGGKLKKSGFIHIAFLAIWLVFAQNTHKQFTRDDAGVVSGRVINNEFEKETKIFSSSIESGGIEMSGRGEIWDNYFTFLKNNLAFGYGSKKLIIGKHHAHNSILEIITSHGIIIGSCYLLLILFQLDKNNIVVIGTFFIASLAQYIIFWGVSYADIIFMWFLLPSLKEKLDYDT